MELFRSFLAKTKQLTEKGEARKNKLTDKMF